MRVPEHILYLVGRLFRIQTLTSVAYKFVSSPDVIFAPVPSFFLFCSDIFSIPPLFSVPALSVFRISGPTYFSMPSLISLAVPFAFLFPFEMATCKFCKLILELCEIFFGHIGFKRYRFQSKLYETEPSGPVSIPYDKHGIWTIPSWT